MDIQDAMYHTAHDYPGGTESLAPRLGMSGAILRNKVNPHNPANKLTLAEASKMMAVTADYRILHAMAAEHGFAAYQISSSPVCDTAVLEVVVHLMRSNGDLGVAVEDALTDGRVDASEMERIRDAAYALHAAVEQVCARMQVIAG